jgi:UDP-N-acetylglucosamine acyltransferase
VTTVGDNCLFMASSHVAHDCYVEDNVVMANNATLGGHVHVRHHVMIGGLAAIQQFIRIGEYSMIAGISGVADDVIPYSTVIGNRAKLSGLNIIGLKRNNFSKEEIVALRKTYRMLFFELSGEMSQRLKEFEVDLLYFSPVKSIYDFISKDFSRTFCIPRAKVGFVDDKLLQNIG